MKTKLLILCALLGAFSLRAESSGVDSTNAAGVVLSPDQLNKLNGGIDNLIPLIPAQYQSLVVHAVAIIGVLAMLGRVIVGWRNGGLFGVIAGLFGGTNAPKPASNDPPSAPLLSPRAKSNLPLALLLPGLFFSPVIFAQDATNPPPAVTATNSFWIHAAAAGKDLLTYVKLMPFTTNTAATLRMGAGENTATHELVEAATLTVPISDRAGIGIIGAHLGSQWLEGGVSLSYGGTTSLPLLGTVNLFAGDGVVFDFITRAPANYVFTGAEKDWTISNKCHAGIGAVTANTSDRAGVDIIGGGHITWTF